jgi:hypothetical protein
MLEERHRAYLQDAHQSLRTDPGARKGSFTRIVPQDEVWKIEQTLVDPDEHNDWQALFELDVEKTRALARPVLVFQGIGPVA